MKVAVTSASGQLGTAIVKLLIQQFTYPAMVLVALHWALKEEGGIGPVLVHFVPLALFEIYRIYRFYNPIRQLSEASYRKKDQITLS